MEKEMGWLLKEKYNGRPSEKFYKDVQRIKAGEPVDYVIGFTKFLDCEIDLSKKPLIPRQDTAFWVEQELKNIHKGNALDIFSGSGCIGVVILKKRKGLLCDFADIDKKAIEQIKINCQLNKIKRKRYKIIRSDIFKKIKGKYDYIFANPPYVATKKIYNIQKSVLKYEPKIALFAGSDGLYFIRKFLSDAKKHLNPDGKIFMEFSPEQKPAIEKIILSQPRDKYSNFEFKKDHNNRWRWVVVA
jgi:release factor glutamine methyltransferase